MLSNIMKKAAVIAFGLVLTPALWAAQYQVTVDGQIQKDNSSTTIFGLSAASIPMHFTFVVDTSLAPVVTLSAGSSVGSGSTLPANTQLISKNSITNSNFVFGTGSWLPNSLVANSFQSGQNFDVLLSGNLADGATPQIFFVLNNASGVIQVGDWSCNPNATCFFGNSGTAFSTGDSGFAAVVNIQASVTALSKTASEQIADVVETVDAITTIDKGTKTSLSASLGGALDKLDPTIGVDLTAAKGKLDAFINKVLAQSGKKLTAQQASGLIAAANAIKNSL